MAWRTVSLSLLSEKSLFTSLDKALASLAVTLVFVGAFMMVIPQLVCVMDVVGASAEPETSAGAGGCLLVSLHSIFTIGAISANINPSLSY